eukprot:3941484-Rhodomonas_salina.2
MGVKRCCLGHALRGTCAVYPGHLDGSMTMLQHDVRIFFVIYSVCSPISLRHIPYLPTPYSLSPYVSSTPSLPQLHSLPTPDTPPPYA